MQISIRNILTYINGKITPARHLTDQAVRNYLPELNGHVIEIGARGDGYSNFSKCDKYVLTNITKENISYVELDVTHMNINDQTVDGYVCVSVLEHIQEPILAISEMYRTLKPGGKLLLIVPFMYPYHADPYDYLRFTANYLDNMLKDFQITKMELLGNSFSTASLILQKPFRSKKMNQLRKESKPRYLLYKIITFPLTFISRFIGLALYVASAFVPCSEDYASMVCVVAQKK